MKALTLTQPWAMLMVLGVKHIETRGWSTPYNGPLAIHAAKRWTADDRDFLSDLIRDGILPQMPTASVPLGAVVGEVYLSGCIRVRSLDDMVRRVPPFAPLTALEMTLGDYTPGRYGWITHSPVAYPEPISARGALGLWEWQSDTPVSGFGAVTVRDGAS